MVIPVGLTVREQSAHMVLLAEETCTGHEAALELLRREEPQPDEPPIKPDPPSVWERIADILRWVFVGCTSSTHRREVKEWQS
jgi:hypothetical protein